ncbi:DEAD-box ATP-dependent RNA helicase 22 [Linum perenne]
MGPCLRATHPQQNDAVKSTSSEGFKVLHLYKLSSSSSPKILFSQLTRAHSFLSVPFSLSNGRRFTTAAAAAPVNGGDTFFADESVSWTALGLSETIAKALTDVGFQRPSLVQAESIPSILSGKDSVIAAETGSGKTHSYLVPLIHKLYTGRNDSDSPSRGVSLVLCPNVLLCDQVVRMANGLCDENGDPLLKVAAVCGRQGWPVHQPDILVSTPAALLNSIEPKKQRKLSFVRGVKYVVFDEADMLLCGSFQNQVIRLINMFRYDEKILSWTSQSPAVDAAAEVVEDSESLPEDALEDEGEALGDDLTLAGDEEDLESIAEDEVVEEGNEAGLIKKRGWRRIKRVYERSKQYIFVAATLPVNGKKTAGAVLKWMFPEANWISGSYLHCHNPRLERRWIEVTVDSQVDALIEALKQGDESEKSSNRVSRTMVFANTVEAVEAVAGILERAGIECYRYHKEGSLEERASTLDDFRENGGIFVCTDAAARGVDIPNISHVVQADFATSAVDFLHRVGRTGRAGQYGLVTSLYTDSNRDLVSAIREAERMGLPVETAFSRKRSFRNKLKKRGVASRLRNSETAELATA